MTTTSQAFLVKAASSSVETLFSQQQTASDGLTDTEAAKRLEQYGKNILTEKRHEPVLKLFLQNFSSLMAILLWSAGAIALFTGTIELGIAIWLVNVINGLFSFWQQYRAAKATDALKKMLPTYVTVLREGKKQQIAVEDIVVGDIITLNSGDNIPADARLFHSTGMQVDQSALTGESAAVSKEAATLTAEQIKAAGQFAESNLLYAGTSVVSGNGRALVLATGMNTEFGQIASLTQDVVQQKSPLEKELDRLTRQISLIAICIGALFFVTAILFVDYPWAKAFIFSLGMIVAFIPEGLLPTVTLSLALAVQKMAKRNALVKHLNSVETLGETTVICSDKTGTLTKNQMTVQKIWQAGAEFAVSGTGYNTIGQVTKNGQAIELAKEPDLLQLIRVGALCNNSQLLKKEADTCQLIGQPDEGSLLSLAAKSGFDQQTEAAAYPRIGEVPFDSKRKKMSTIHEQNKQRWIFTKGGIDEILRCSTAYLDNQSSKPLTEEAKKMILAENDRLAKEGLRLLALAFRKVPAADSFNQLQENEFTIQNTERELTFVGMTAMQDPPRENVLEAIQKCRDASIRIIMVTGDHGLTAESIARQIGIVQGDDVRIVTGDALYAMSDEELKENLRHEIIFARVAPEQKYRVVTALQELGEVVASTGDGVNDAPALKKADIGVAMGIAGTDVAKEAADMILTDDNFTSIVNAIEEGRTVYSNIQKFLLYILNSNAPEAIPSVFFLLSRGLIPLPLTVMQILSVDLGTDMFPALGLSGEATELGTMKQPPRPKDQHLLSYSLLLKAFAWYGLLAGIISIGAYFLVNYLNGWPNIPLASSGTAYSRATTMTLAAIIFCQIAAVFNCRTKRASLFKVGLFSNRKVLFGILTELLILAALIYVPFLQELFHTAPLTLTEWGLLLLIPLPLILVEELRKAWVRKKQRVNDETT